MSNAHTPGPWKSTCSSYCTVESHTLKCENAERLLIAFAPEMLEALERALEQTLIGDKAAVIDILGAAIAKATGGGK